MPVTEIKSTPQVLENDIDNHKPQACVGVCSQNLLNKLFEDKETSALDQKKFYAGTLAFYLEPFLLGN